MSQLPDAKAQARIHGKHPIGAPRLGMQRRAWEHACAALSISGIRPPVRCFRPLACAICHEWASRAETAAHDALWLIAACRSFPRSYQGSTSPSAEEAGRVKEAAAPARETRHRALAAPVLTRTGPPEVARNDSADDLSYHASDDPNSLRQRGRPPTRRGGSAVWAQRRPHREAHQRRHGDLWGSGGRARERTLVRLLYSGREEHPATWLICAQYSMYDA